MLDENLANSGVDLPDLWQSVNNVAGDQVKASSSPLQGNRLLKYLHAAILIFIKQPPPLLFYLITGSLKSITMKPEQHVKKDAEQGNSTSDRGFFDHRAEKQQKGVSNGGAQMSFQTSNRDNERKIANKKRARTTLL